MVLSQASWALVYKCGRLIDKRGKVYDSIKKNIFSIGLVGSLTNADRIKDLTDVAGVDRSGTWFWPLRD